MLLLLLLTADADDDDDDAWIVVCWLYDGDTLYPSFVRSSSFALYHSSVLEQRFVQ